jgi:hypothetical protein
MGGLVVQQALARYAVRVAVLVAPIAAHPAVSSLAAIAGRHPLDALRIVVGASLPLRTKTFFPSWTRRMPRRMPTGAGHGHDLMRDARWREPLDAMLHWLPKALASH